MALELTDTVSRHLAGIARKSPIGGRKPPLVHSGRVGMASLRHGFVLLMKHNNDGGFTTKRDRVKALELIAKQLNEGGFRHLSTATLKERHVRYLVERWRSEGLAVGTIKNRMTHLRWAYEKAGRGHLLSKDNDAFGIERRTIVNNDANRAKELDRARLAAIPDERVRLSLELQAAFGLRREESIKFAPSVALTPDGLALKASWTKGGRPRDIPIRTDEQRALIERVRVVAGKGSLIPFGKNYQYQRDLYDRLTRNAGLSNNHGLRHQYAQQLYREITGIEPPKCGGPGWRELTPEQRAIDRDARQQISRELGHERESITAVYLGR